MSPSTTWAGSRSCTRPSRTTLALGRMRMAMRSITRLARTSWIRLMTVLARMTKTTTKASSGLPRASSTAPST